MRSELLLACISGPLLAALLLRGNARRLLAAVSGGMLAAFISGTVSGALAGIVQYDSMAAVLYISPLVEEGAKLLLFALFFFIWQLQEGETQEIVIGIGIGFSLLESIALLFSSGNASLLALFFRCFFSSAIHVACALMLILSIQMIHRMAMETVTGLMAVYAVTVTVHALYNLLVSCAGLSRVLGYMLPVALIGAGKVLFARQRLERGEKHAHQ